MYRKPHETSSVAQCLGLGQCTRDFTLREPVSLHDPGNWCYLNAILQILKQTVSFEDQPGTDSVRHTNTLSATFASLRFHMHNIHAYAAETAQDARVLRELLEKKCSRFDGHHQQDSHEALRHLLEGIKDEQKQSGVTETSVDKVFGGHHITTFICAECGHPYHLLEPFLDVSLPIPSASNKKNKKENSSHMKQDRILDGNNVKYISSITNEYVNELSHQYFTVKFESVLVLTHGISGSCSEANISSNVEEVTIGLSDQFENFWLVTETWEPRTTSRSSTCSSQPSTHITDRLFKRTDNNLSRLVAKFASVYQELRQLTKSDTGIVAAAASNLSLQHSSEAAGRRQRVKISETSRHDIELSEYRKAVTFARMRMDDDTNAHSVEEHSIESCLQYFTRLEQLDRDHAGYLCLNCNEGSSFSPQIREGDKQTLIFNPPHILTLHLKRFEQMSPHAAYRKVDDFVSYPPQLDLTPFCSKLCAKHLNESTTPILYSLYGIVVHRGTLESGHYTACVKVRSIPDVEHFQSQGQVRSFRNGNLKTKEQLIELMKWHLERKRNDCRPVNRRVDHRPRRSASTKEMSARWYLIDNLSTTTVRPIDEETALRQQAYLLFYERIQ